MNTSVVIPIVVENAPEMHECPYLTELFGDYETLCDCDEQRTHECAMDI